MNQPTEPTIAIDVYRTRRERVLAALRAAGGGVAIVPTAPEALRNRDTDYPYRHDSYFYYLTGFTEPEALLVLDASAAPGAPASMLFCREKSVERETWEGFRFGPDGAREAFGLDAAFPIGEIDTQLPRIIADKPALHYAFGTSAHFDEQVRGWLDAVRAQSRGGTVAPTAARDLLPLLDEMRLVKDDHDRSHCRRSAGKKSAASARRLQRRRL